MSDLRQLINLCEDKQIITEARGCQRCGSDALLQFSGKCSDLCWTMYKGQENNGYVPSGIGIDQNDGYGDYVQGNLCMKCGQMQGRFPISQRNLIKVFGKDVAEPRENVSKMTAVLPKERNVNTP